jgi:hypothetical protein
MAAQPLFPARPVGFRSTSNYGLGHVHGHMMNAVGRSWIMLFIAPGDLTARPTSWSVSCGVSSLRSRGGGSSRSAFIRRQRSSASSGSSGGTPQARHRCDPGARTLLPSRHQVVGTRCFAVSAAGIVTRSLLCAVEPWKLVLPARAPRAHKRGVFRFAVPPLGKGAKRNDPRGSPEVAPRGRIVSNETTKLLLRRRAF